MPHTPDISNGNGSQIKLGTTGRIGSLMSRELEPIKNSPHAAASSSSQKKLQDPPVSVPCGYSPNKRSQRKNPTNDPESSSKSPRDTEKHTPKPRRQEQKSPMLASAETALEKNTSREKVEKKKKRHTHIVEVVDIKCNNPMSSRLKKLGFSKLSESTV